MTRKSAACFIKHNTKYDFTVAWTNTSPSSGSDNLFLGRQMASAPFPRGAHVGDRYLCNKQWFICSAWSHLSTSELFWQTDKELAVMPKYTGWFIFSSLRDCGAEHRRPLKIKNKLSENPNFRCCTLSQLFPHCLKAKSLLDLKSKLFKTWSSKCWANERQQSRASMC